MQRSDYDQWRSSEVARLLALVESEKRYYQDIFSSLPFPLGVVDTEANLVMVNREFRRRFDLANTELSRVRLSELLPGVDWPAELRSLVESGQARAEVQCVAARGGADQSVRVCLQRHRSWENSSVDEILITLDIPGGQAGSREVLGLPVPAWVLNLNTGNYDQGTFETVDARVAAIWPGDQEAWLRFCRERLAVDQTASFDYRVPDGQGGARWFRDIARLDPSGKVSGVTVEVTVEHRWARQNAEQAKRESTERLSARLSHVINNLLMVVNGYAEELQESMAPEDPRRGDLLEIIKAGGRLSNLTGELNRMTRPPRYTAEDLHLLPWLDDVSERLAALAPEGSFRTAISEPNLVLRINREVLEGLLSDSVRQIAAVLPESGRVALHISPLPSGQAAIWLKVTQCDLGEDWKARFLEPFSGPRQGSDPPLGVAAWVRPWQDLGGTMFVETEPADLFVLGLTCPAEIAAREPGPLILLVEDEESIRTLVQRALAREGYRVVAAASAEEAMVLLKTPAAVPDLLISDVDLPGLNGVDLARRAREIHPSLRLVLISGAASEAAMDEELRRSLPQGLVFLEKPVSPSELMLTVKRTLERASGAANG